MNRVAICVLVACCSLGCPRTKTESPTSGKLTVLVTESLAPLIRQEADEFHRLYPEASVTVLGTSTRDAIVQLLNDSVTFIIVDRQFNEEELGVVKRYELEYVETKIAQDALAVLVNNRNPAENISYASLESILKGRLTTWRNVPESRWSGTIDLVLTPRNSGAYELLTTYFFALDEPLTPRIIAESQHGVFRTVVLNDRAIGFVSLTALHDTAAHPEILQFKNSTRVLAVSGSPAKEQSSPQAGKDSVRAFHKPHQANVYRELYPLHYPVYLYTTGTPSSLASGFSAFVASAPGQKIIQKAGLVPATMPVRLVQITQE